jgi:hypothetical protein
MAYLKMQIYPSPQHICQRIRSNKSKSESKETTIHIIISSMPWLYKTAFGLLLGAFLVDFGLAFLFSNNGNKYNSVIRSKKNETNIYIYD